MGNYAQLKIHLSTDIATGDLRIDFDPVEDDHIPVPIEDWPEIRKSLRETVRKGIDDPEAWEAHLDSNRMGQRLDVEIGTLRLSSEGEVSRFTLWHTAPSDVDW